MNKIDFKNLLSGIGVYLALLILFAIFNSWLRSYIESVLFGDVGAYSHEDHVAVVQHTTYQTFDMFFELLKVTIPCFFVSYNCKNGEVWNSFAMSTIAALVSTLTTYSWFPTSQVITFVFTAILYSIVSIPIGILTGYVKNKRVST